MGWLLLLFCLFITNGQKTNRNAIKSTLKMEFSCPGVTLQKPRHVLEVPKHITSKTEFILQTALCSAANVDISDCKATFEAHRPEEKELRRRRLADFDNIWVFFHLVLHRLNHNFDDHFQTFLSRISSAGFKDNVNEKLKHLGGAWNCATVLDVAEPIRSGEDCANESSSCSFSTLHSGKMCHTAPDEEGLISARRASIGADSAEDCAQIAVHGSSCGASFSYDKVTGDCLCSRPGYICSGVPRSTSRVYIFQNGFFTPSSFGSSSEINNGGGWHRSHNEPTTTKTTTTSMWDDGMGLEDKSDQPSWKELHPDAPEDHTFHHSNHKRGPPIIGIDTNVTPYPKKDINSSNKKYVIKTTVGVQMTCFGGGSYGEGGEIILLKQNQKNIHLKQPPPKLIDKIKNVIWITLCGELNLFDPEDCKSRIVAYDGRQVYGRRELNENVVVDHLFFYVAIRVSAFTVTKGKFRTFSKSITAETFTKKINKNLWRYRAHFCPTATHVSYPLKSGDCSDVGYHHDCVFSTYSSANRCEIDPDTSLALGKHLRTKSTCANMVSSTPNCGQLFSYSTLTGACICAQAGKTCYTESAIRATMYTFRRGFVQDAHVPEEQYADMYSEVNQILKHPAPIQSFHAYFFGSYSEPSDPNPWHSTSGRHNVRLTFAKMNVLSKNQKSKSYAILLFLVGLFVFLITCSVTFSLCCPRSETKKDEVLLEDMSVSNLVQI